MTSALSLLGLSKSFGAKRAVDDLFLDVRAGCIFGLVGPNGAGKTTTLSMATGLLRPDAGTAYVLGHDVWSDPARAKALMGLLPDGLRLFDRLSGGELLRYVGLLRRVPPDTIASRSAELLDALARISTQLVRAMSGTVGCGRSGSDALCERWLPCAD